MTRIIRYSKFGLVGKHHLGFRGNVDFRNGIDGYSRTRRERITGVGALERTSHEFLEGTGNLSESRTNLGHDVKTRKYSKMGEWMYPLEELFGLSPVATSAGALLA